MTQMPKKPLFYGTLFSLPQKNFWFFKNAKKSHEIYVFWGFLILEFFAKIALFLGTYEPCMTQMKNLNFVDFSAKFRNKKMGVNLFSDTLS